jgi:hypothetical protein
MKNLLVSAKLNNKHAYFFMSTMDQKLYHDSLKFCFIQKIINMPTFYKKKDHKKLPKTSK